MAFLPTFDTILQAIDELEPAERTRLAERLAAKKMDDIKAAAENNRMARLKAAAKDRSVAFVTACRSLQRLGLDIEAVADKADIDAVDAAMADAGWKTDERIKLKSVLASIGAVE
jgi:hypothetical protein